jgi:CxxC motif-containing protein (DUF1111 family)
MKARMILGWSLSALVACNGSGDDATATAPSAAAADANAASAPSASIAAALPQATAQHHAHPPPGHSGGSSNSTAKDPGVRDTAGAAGGALPGLSAGEQAAFDAGKADFIEAEAVADGLGPTMNLDSCGGCHAQPAVGGTSPAANPQLALAAKLGATNAVPPFLSASGPVREARFVRNADGSPDGGVHAVFTIAGRSDAAGCSIAKPDFAAAVAQNNVIFRIPTPLFGVGLIEQIPDSEILANKASNAGTKSALGVRGRGNRMVPSQTITAQPNKNGNDGTLGRFGWKAQNKSLLVFAGEAYNVEMGISNELFPTERDETASCQFATLPNSVSDLEAATPIEALSSIEKFAIFMRLLAPPAPSSDTPGGSASVANGKALFATVGCALCHTPTLHTGNTAVAALRGRNVDLYSDLLLHDMGVGLADGIMQGQAGPRDFRTAPLWGLGQRLFFLHDGRTTDLRAALIAHQSDRSEANGVVYQFTRLLDTDQQDLLNFLRSL